MRLDIAADNLQGIQNRVQLDDIPDQCPLCHRSVHPKSIIAAYLEERSFVQTIFRCTNQKCQELFIGSYSLKTAGIYTLSKVAPKTSKGEIFSESINDLSPTFVEIYNQSLSAEAEGLSQLVGIGIRKALEFLVKDFAVKKHPDDEGQIRKLFLGKCIDTYLKDSNIKACAKRAVWLGNDEAHYSRKWEDKDINDLKLLTKLTVNWIENVLLTEKYIHDMEESKT